MNENQRAVVTGGSRGIGLAIAKALAAHCYDVVITGRDASSLKETARSLCSPKARVFGAAADLADPKGPETLVKQAAELLGGIDLLVNNAGVTLSCPLEESTLEQWEAVMTVNARAPYFICQHALPHLRRSQNPVIIQIGSVVAHKAYELQSIYGASKHALSGFTKALAREVAGEGIRVHMVSPGGAATDMISEVRPDIDTSEMIAPEEIADIVLFLARQRGKGVIDEIQVRRSSKLPWS